MEVYPEELRTPPVALAALVGCPELHANVTKHLHSEQPPINTLALPDFSKIVVIAKSQKGDTSLSDQSSGILKRDWLQKHRTRVPAVVAAFFSSDQVSGDPTQWLQVCTDLDSLKAVLRERNIKLVIVVVVSSTSNADLSEDHMIALKKRAEIDSKHIITFSPNNNLEMKESLNRLGTIFAELANTYYRDEGRKVKTRLERKSLSSVELSIRYCFKVAVYAEFRRDWVEAIRMYEEAYHTLREMIGTTPKSPAIQWMIEIKTVAEQLHFKVSTLLLHAGKLTEAITWFRQHHASYKKLVGAPEVSFLHWEWLSRQFLVFAELLETSLSFTQSISSPVPGTKDRLTELEYRSSYYYQLAAHYLKEKKSCSEFTLSMTETIDNDVDSIIPSIYIGQYARITEGEACSVKRVTDEDYVRYALAEEKRSQDFSMIVVLLKRCFEAYNDLKAPRMASYCGFEMAKEYVATGEFQSAKELLDSVASLYRKEGWVILLWDVLGYLRECSMKLGSAKDFVEYSLEMAALPVLSSSGVQPLSFNSCILAGPPSLSQRELIQKEVFNLVRGESGNDNNLEVTDAQPLHLVIDLVSPLRAVLLASAAFHEQLVKPGAPTPMTLSILSQLPLTVEIDQLDIQFNQSACNFSVINGQRSGIRVLDSQPNLRIETAPSLTLSTNKWLRLTYDITSDLGGKLECVSIIARNGPNFTICCIAESPASMSELPLWKFEDRVESSPVKDPLVSFSGQKAIQVEEPDPLVDLKLGVSGPALVGERFFVPVTILSKGHAVLSGELKINLVDVRGTGFFSPRDLEPSNMDNLQVELLGVSGLENEDKKLDDNIEKIQPSFGLISIPAVNEGESWSCKLEIRWRRPKPVMLYVSLGYSPKGSDNKVHVHRNLEIEGKNPVLITHRFMLPFRKDPLLLSSIKPNDDPIQTTPTPTLPLNETSILVITAKNVTEVPLRLLSMSIKRDDDNDDEKNSDVSGFTLLQGDDEFKKIFTILPKLNQPKLKTGTLHLSWRRDSTTDSEEETVLTEHVLPEVNVELPPIVVQLESPPHAILGNDFTYSIRIKNQTQLLQEIKFSLADSQSFVLSGTHNDVLFVLPKSEHTLSYKLVPLVSGFQQLPRFTATSLRYSAGFQSSSQATSVFVFPSVPHFVKENEGKAMLVE